MTMPFAMPDGAAPSPPHDELGSLDLAAFVDGTLSGERRRRVVRHLASCAACRAEAAEVSSMLETAPVSRPTWARGSRMLTTLAAVAATLVVVFLPRERPSVGVTPLVPQRAMSESSTVLDDDAPAVQLQAPVADDTIEGAVRFSWRAAATDADYALSIQDSSGTVVRSISTRDTTLVVPRNAQLAAGAAYFWSVETRMADGRGARSTVRRFTLR